MKFISIVFLFLLSSLTTSAFASNFSFLDNAPVRHLTAKDWQLLEDASEVALSKNPNMKKAEWSNPNSQNSGYLQPIDKTTKNGRTCRHLKIFYKTPYGDNASVFEFCRYPSGWKIPSTDD